MSIALQKCIDDVGRLSMIGKRLIYKRAKHMVLV